MKNFVVFILGLFLLSCNTVSVPTGDFDEKVKFNDQNRKYLVHVPPSYTEKEPVALLFALHFYSGNREAMAHVTGLSETSDSLGFICCYPESFGFSWLDSDTGFILFLLEELSAEYNIDVEKVYVAGYSNGAGLAHLLAAKSSRIKGTALIAGSLMQTDYSDLEPVESTPTIFFHSRNDSALLYYGDDYYPAVETVVRAWAQSLECEDIPDSVYNDSGCLRQTWASDSCQVVLWTSEEGNHYWPCVENGHGLSANELMWVFFTSQ